MGKVLWEIAKIGGSIIGFAILLTLADGGGSYTKTKPRGSGPRARIYRPTGRSRGYGPRSYQGTKSYW
jgi:hypothetical protein